MDGTGSTEHDPYTRVTVAEAAASLGVSVVTVRRMIRRGQLEGERVHRPHGTAYVVKLPVDGSGDATATEQPAQDVSRANGTGQPAPAEAIAAMIQATLTPIIAPLVGELAATRQQNERLTDQLMNQAGTIADLREERGRQSAELERAAATIVTLNAMLEARTAAHVSPEPSTSLRRLWARWWPLWAVLVALMLAVALLVWPR